jgi:predicted lipid-binding transport protein (Tim44 family)
MPLTTPPTPIRLVILGAVLALFALAPACGGSSDTAASAASTSTSATSSSVATPSSSVVTPSPSITTSSPAVASPSPSGSATVSTGDSAWQATGDDLSAAETATKRFVEAIDAQDFGAASDLMAPDAGFQLEDITNEVARMALARSTMHVFPDEQGTPHLAMKGSGVVKVVAIDGAELDSGSHKFAVELRRDSRRDEWRVWYFNLQHR